MDVSKPSGDELVALQLAEVLPTHIGLHNKPYRQRLAQTTVLPQYEPRTVHVKEKSCQHQHTASP